MGGKNPTDAGVIINIIVCENFIPVFISFRLLSGPALWLIKSGQWWLDGRRCIRWIFPYKFAVYLAEVVSSCSVVPSLFWRVFTILVFVAAHVYGTCAVNCVIVARIINEPFQVAVQLLGGIGVVYGKQVAGSSVVPVVHILAGLKG